MSGSKIQAQLLLCRGKLTAVTKAAPKSSGRLSEDVLGNGWHRQNANVTKVGFQICHSLEADLPRGSPVAGSRHSEGNSSYFCFFTQSRVSPLFRWPCTH